MADYCRLLHYDLMLPAVHEQDRSIWCLLASCASWQYPLCSCNDTPAAAAFFYWVYPVKIDDRATWMSQLATQSLLAFQAMGSGGTARQPETGKGKDAPQYFGTVVYDPSSASNLPVLEW